MIVNLPRSRRLRQRKPALGERFIRNLSA